MKLQKKYYDNDNLGQNVKLSLKKQLKNKLIKF